MYALWLILSMNGHECSAVALCEHDVASCEAVVVSCDGPVTLEACLNEASAYTPEEHAAALALPEPEDPTAEGAFDAWPEPVYGLGCSTDLSRGFPATVDFDADELQRVAGAL